MSLEKAKDYLTKKGYENRIHLFDVSSATVELAALALNTLPAHIAKSLTFKVNEQPIMIVCAGDVKVDNSKYKKYFHVKAKMLSKEEVSTLIGHDVGGVCPFGINKGVDIYLDESLKQFETIYPACGNASSAVKLSPQELESILDFKEWIDVCKSL